MNILCSLQSSNRQIYVHESIIWLIFHIDLPIWAESWGAAAQDKCHSSWPNMLRSSHISANLWTFSNISSICRKYMMEWPLGVDKHRWWRSCTVCFAPKNTRNKKAEEYLSTQDHHFQLLYCCIFLCFFLNTFCVFFVLGGLVAPYVSYRQFFVTEGSTLLPVPEWKVPVLPHQPIPTLTSQQA